MRLEEKRGRFVLILWKVSGFLFELESGFTMLQMTV